MLSPVYIGLRVKHLFFLLEFNENSPIGRFVACGRTGSPTHTHNGAKIVVLRNFANARNIEVRI